MTPRASRLPLLAHCSWWARPEVADPVASVGTAATTRGTAVHAAIEAVLKGTPAPTLDDEAAPFFATWLEWWQGQDIEPVAIEERAALAVATGAVREVGRDEAAKDREVIGTPDLIARDGGTLQVLDWKTGDDFQGYTTAAVDNLQLRTYAAMAAGLFDEGTVEVRIVRITTDGVVEDRHTYDALDLAAHVEWLRDRLAAAPISEPTPGMHCARCDAASVCPATLATVYRLTKLGTATARLEITEENAARVLERVAAIEEAASQVRDALKAFALASGGIALPGGKVWGPRSQVRETIDADAPDVADVLDAAGIGAALKTKRSVSWTDAEAIAREANGGKLPRGWKESLKKRLGAMGALKVVEVVQYGAR